MGLFQRNTRHTTKEEPIDRFPEYVSALVGESEGEFTSGTITGTTGNREFPNYGIEKAIKLIRKLPDEKSPAMVAIVRDTLESADINVDSIINDAQQRAAEIQQRIALLSNDIEDLQTLIANKQQEISDSTDILDETHKVRTLLEAAESAQKKSIKKNSAITMPVALPNLVDAERTATLSEVMAIAGPIGKSA